MRKAGITRCRFIGCVKFGRTAGGFGTGRNPGSGDGRFGGRGSVTSRGAVRGSSVRFTGGDGGGSATCKERRPYRKLVLIPDGAAFDQTIFDQTDEDLRAGVKPAQVQVTAVAQTK